MCIRDRPKGEIDTYRVKAYYKKNGKTVISKYSNAQSAKLFDSTKLSSVTPVSYTHLDVYKRQSIWYNGLSR